jgi:WD40 repeat protein
MDSSRSNYYRLYVASRAFIGAEFSTPRELMSLNVYGEGGPYVTPDGSVLYFHSWRGGNNADLYRATRNGTVFNEPELLTSISTGAHEFYPVVTPDELTIYYFTEGDPLGRNGIWMATRATLAVPFGNAVHLSALNGSRDAVPDWISPDGCRLYYIQRDTSYRHWPLVVERAGTAGTSGGGTGRGGTGGSGGGGSGGATAGTGGGGSGGATAGTGGGGTGGGTAGTGGSGSGGTAPPTVGMCTASAVTSCPQPTAGQCEEKFCGGRLWRDGAYAFSNAIPYRILDPQGKFPESYKNAIRTGAAAWSAASSGVVTFRECVNCFGRFVSVVPGDGDGIVGQSAFEQLLPMPVDAASLANLPLHRIAHQWGHAIGLGHTYERADRDRYVRFDPALWCGPQRPGTPPRCAFGPALPGSPPVASDTFGVYDEKSKMNGFATDGICASSEPDARSGEPSQGDAAAVNELLYSHWGGWAPWRPIGRSVSPTQPLDYQLAPGVDPTGSPAVASWTSPGVSIFVRGTDEAVYGIQSELFGSVFLGWSDWQQVATAVDADPAVAYAAPDTLHLAVRSRSGDIRLRTRTGTAWGPWGSLGAPAVGASAPAIAARDTQMLHVMVLGDDGILYMLTCTDPAAMCAASASGSNAWVPLSSPPPGPIIGKPSLGWIEYGYLMVGAVAHDRTTWINGNNLGGVDWGTWLRLPYDLEDYGDPSPSFALETTGNSVLLFARDAQGSLIAFEHLRGLYSPLGGVLTSAPGAASSKDKFRSNVAAVIDDHGRPGVWWKFNGAYDGYTPPCNYNAPGMCAECGCNVPNAPSCEQ